MSTPAIKALYKQLGLLNAGIKRATNDETKRKSTAERDRVKKEIARLEEIEKVRKDLVRVNKTIAELTMKKTQLESRLRQLGENK